MKYLHYLLIPAVLYLLTNTGCKKITGCERNMRYDFEFELPVSIYPAKDTFSIGDTIWIEQSFSDNMLNLKYNRYKEFKDFNFHTTFTIKDLNTPLPAYSYPDPNIITYVGQTTGNNIGSVKYQAIYINYTYENNTYKYKAAFIVDKPGFYNINFFSYLDGDDLNLTRCQNEIFHLYYTTNDKGDNNYEMVQYAQDNSFAELTKEKYDKSGMYCFHVK